MFTSGATAALIKDAFPEQVGIVVSQDALRSKELAEVMDDLSDVPIVELEPEPDRADESVLIPENSERIFSVVVKDVKLPVDNVACW